MSVIFSVPDVTTSSRPLKLVSSLSSWSVHLPLSLALVDLFCPANFAFTSVPALAQPQMVTGLPRCSTILLCNRFGKRSSFAVVNCRVLSTLSRINVSRMSAAYAYAFTR